MEVVVNGRSSKGAQGLPPYFGYKRRNCAVPENIHTPPNRRDWNFLGVEGSVRPKHLKKCIKLNWNWKGWGVLEKNPFCGVGMDIIWNYTLQKDEKPPGQAKQNPLPQAQGLDRSLSTNQQTKKMMGLYCTNFALNYPSIKLDSN